MCLYKNKVGEEGSLVHNYQMVGDVAQLVEEYSTSINETLHFLPGTT